MITLSKQSPFVEMGRIFINLSYRLRALSEEKKRREEKRSRLKMAILSGSIRRVK